MTEYDYDAWFAIFTAYHVCYIEWTWYVQYNEEWTCTNEQITLHDGSHKRITQIDEQELFEAIWEISEATSADGPLRYQRGVFRLDVATRRLCKLADVGDWETDGYDPDSGPYVPSIHPLPDDDQPCAVI